MGLDYYMYHTKTGALISKERYAGLPFLNDNAEPFIHPCIAKGDLDHIDEWTMDEDSELWESEISKYPWFGDDDILIYCSRADILFLQEIMTCNKTLLEELIDEYDSDGLIIRIF